ncbi:valine--tRNA ligase [Mycoplasma phocimorsus]|uniref:valine--tRNA ligase n=1 Tax=Mycoplasma phocimorsus TaxID=3045839 RepID=UPI0024C0D0B0|nr:valine--tRNA ligase [Mycoplasma phocimorsus]MDJ1646370.1 valine--tRNA ligase [Mycoplasma phocimorsus]
MEKIFDFAKYEKLIYEKWQDAKYFTKRDEAKKPFTILLPPPNVTGVLHLGHALDTYLPDSILRYKKLRGFDTWFITGTDHAGIATQSKVESKLYQQGINKLDIGREKFLEECWKWKEEYSKNIHKQWDRLGLSLDYENERFTLDKDANEAVLKAFITLYKKGLIYRDSKAISWDPKLKTALSNVEVINKEIEQEMVYIKYPIANSNDFLTIATVRPETLFSDVAVLYNPADERFKHLKNKKIIHPLLNKELPILSDEYIDMKFGTGLMKLSAHASNDIEIIKKLGLEINETIDESGILYNANQFNNLDRFTARKEIIKYLKEQNFIEKIEKTISSVGISDRSKEVVEILVRKQWFVKMDKFADMIIKDLKSKNKSKFYPERFEKELKLWMDKVYDWTISRQLWWGHQIPAWYKNDKVLVQIESPGEGWIRDEDVLDTWFSSGLAPFAFMGWPQSEKLINRYYPVDLLVTGRDLIFFWIARMYMFSLEFQSKAPFKDIMIHGLVRDENNVKFSKSLGNGIDPIDVINKYGSDALRWALISGTKAGTDLRIGNKDFVNSQAIITKLWNAARYINSKKESESSKTIYDKWIENELYSLNEKIDKHISKYEFNLITKEISDFIFNKFSSWYLELSKNENNKKFNLENIKKLLFIIHPFLPFVTEAIHLELFNDSIFEMTMPNFENYEDNIDVEMIIDIVTLIRVHRENNQISNKQLVEWNFESLEEQYTKSIEKMSKTIEKMTNSLFIKKDESVSSHSLKTGIISFYLTDEIKIKKEQEIEEKIKFFKAEVKRSLAILSNEKFISKAPESKIQEERDKYENYKSQLKFYQKEKLCN